MLFAPRVSTKPLTEFLRRLGMSLEAGIDIRKALASEARRSQPALRQRVELMSEQINQGSTLTAAMSRTGQYFPVLVRELISVGEQTGHLPEVLKQLVTHYDGQMSLRRNFLTAIAWPMLQLSMALLVVGLLIWVSGFIRNMNGKGDKTDILGFGLVGEAGLVVYILFLAAVACGIYYLYHAVLAGKLWTAPIQRFVLKVPVLGTTLQSLSVARFAWTLQVTMGAAIDVKKALSLSLASTHNVQFTDQQKFVEEMIQRGETVHETLAATGVFPIEFIHAVQVGEESGRLVETLAIVAQQQMESAKIAMAMLTKIAGFLVWAVVALLLISLIFRIFGSYVNQINELTKPMK